MKITPQEQLDPEVVRILDLFHQRVGHGGGGLPIESVRSNGDATKMMASTGLWRRLPVDTCIGATFGRTFHLPKNCPFYQADRDKLAAMTHPGKLERSGFIFYWPESGMGWHTNANRPGKRFYYVHTDNGSIFSYAQGGVEVSIDEPPGWHLKEFDIPEKGDPLFHSILATSFRLSIGFRLLKETNA